MCHTFQGSRLRRQADGARGDETPQRHRGVRQSQRARRDRDRRGRAVRRQRIGVKAHREAEVLALRHDRRQRSSHKGAVPRLPPAAAGPQRAAHLHASRHPAFVIAQQELTRAPMASHPFASEAMTFCSELCVLTADFGIQEMCT